MWNADGIRNELRRLHPSLLLGKKAFFLFLLSSPQVIAERRVSSKQAKKVSQNVRTNYNQNRVAGGKSTRRVVSSVVVDGGTTISCWVRILEMSGEGEARMRASRKEENFLRQQSVI
jgi:hypothetical protein